MEVTVPIHVPCVRFRRLMMVPKYFIWHAQCTILRLLIDEMAALTLASFLRYAFGLR